MSVDLPRSTKPLNATVIRDVFVIIGGYGAEDCSQRTDPLPATPAYSGTGDLLERVQGNKIKLPFGHQKKVIGLKGTIIDSDIDDAFDFIQSNFHPLGKLIVYGHSMGGAAALELCRKIDAEAPFYSEYSGLTTDRVSVERTPKAWGPHFFLPDPAMGGLNPLNMPVRVDLLVTVDAARGPRSGSLDRSIAKCVRTNLNYYQTIPYGFEKSFGGPSAAQDRDQTIVWNHDLTNRKIPDPDPSEAAHVPTHITIDEQTNNTVMLAMQEAVKQDQVTAFWDVA
jgi:pimeloyl-ACP methyl ester carboxylesterase